MGLLNLFKTAVINAAEIKSMQAGADILIGKYTSVDTFSIDKKTMKTSNHVVENHLEHHRDQMTDEGAALLKLEIFYLVAERANNEHLMAFFRDAAKTLRVKCGEKISATISMEVAGRSGL